MNYLITFTKLKIKRSVFIWQPTFNVLHTFERLLCNLLLSQFMLPTFVCHVNLNRAELVSQDTIPFASRMTEISQAARCLILLALQCNPKHDPVLSRHDPICVCPGCVPINKACGQIGLAVMPLLFAGFQRNRMTLNIFKSIPSAVI